MPNPPRWATSASPFWPLLLLLVAMASRASSARLHATLLPPEDDTAPAGGRAHDPALPPKTAYSHLLRGDSLCSTASTSSSSMREQEEEAITRVTPPSSPSRPSSNGSWAWELRGEGNEPEARAAKVYCEGDLLATVQLSGIFEDSKEFVDMPMLEDPEEILQAFYALSAEDRSNPGVIKAFVFRYFSTPGTDLIPHDPPDFNPTPPLLESLRNHSQYHDWASELNEFWKQLVRKVPDEVFAKPERYSILRKREPFVVPGGRFRESYYWDSYWIVLGLVACGMTTTAKGLIQNLLDDVNTHGFVPNGGRIYYLNRSQPPLLSEMVMALLQADSTMREDREFVTSALAALDKEYEHWMVPGQHALILDKTPAFFSAPSRHHLHHHQLTANMPDTAEEDLVLNRYYTNAAYPRPESYKEDANTSVAGLKSGRSSSSVYADIAAGAESGWDFSSRWIILSPNGTYELSNIATTAVIPVELNAVMYRMERNLARLHEMVSCYLPDIPDEKSYGQWKSDKAHSYLQASNRRALAMDRFMWNDAEGMWRDYVITEHGVRDQRSPGQGVVSVSSFLPLWSGVLDNEVIPDEDRAHKKKQALVSLQSSGLVQVGGIQTTTKDTGEQWDSPNAWSPIQQMMIEGLERLDCPEAKALALTLVKEWLQSNYLGWASTGYMMEKYNALLPGSRGEGGEYYPQVGFGWTNGVVLHLLHTYGSQL